MTTEYLDIFLKDERVPEPDELVGFGDEEELEADEVPSVEELRERPDVKLVLEAVSGLRESA